MKNLHQLLCCSLALGALSSINAVPLAAVIDHPTEPIWPWSDEATKRDGPADFGYGPGVAIPSEKATRSNAAPTQATSTLGVVPKGGPNAGTQGFFGTPITWPLVAIHAVLLPDGRVMSYGSTAQGDQGAQTIYDVWDPQLGTGSDSHLVLPNTTTTDFFCGAQSVLGSDFPTYANPLKNAGDVLLSGGDLTINGARNFSNNKTTLFLAKQNQLSAVGQMTYARWYATLVPLRNGDRLIIGGILNKTSFDKNPEVYHLGTGWRTVTNINLGNYIWDYSYPRVFLGTDAEAYHLRHSDGRLFRLNTYGDGAMEDMGQFAAPGSDRLPSVMFDSGKILSIRNNKVAQVINFQSPDPKNNVKPTPSTTTLANISNNRYFANLTVLANGKVLLSGGKGVPDFYASTDIAYNADTWDPKTGNWTVGPMAAKARLYHSTALLLPDGTVLTAGGGAPGPVNNLNAEIYYPQYLYLKDGSGNPAPRPTIVSAPSTAKIGDYINVKLGSTAPIKTVTLVHTGSVTHNFDPEQRFLNILIFSQAADTLTVRIPNNANNVPPGYYMLFVFDQSGVPSVAKILCIPRSVL